jgi:hypothetical protein
MGIKLRAAACAIFIVALTGACSGSGHRAAKGSAGTSAASTAPASPHATTRAPTTTRHTPESSTTTSPKRPKQSIVGAWTMKVTRPSFDPAYQALVAPRVTITVAGREYTVTSMTGATVLGSRCPQLPAGTVIANFSRIDAKTYRGSYRVFNTQTCEFYSLQSLTVTVPTFAHPGTQYAFYGIPQYRGVFVKE